MKALAMALLLMSAATAIDFSGNWSGSFKVEGGDHHGVPQLLILKQQGHTLAGSGGPDAGEQYPIENGKINGDAVQFELTTGEWKFTYRLRSVEADSLTGTITLESPDDRRTARVSLTRMK